MPTVAAPTSRQDGGASSQRWQRTDRAPRLRSQAGILELHANLTNDPALSDELLELARRFRLRAAEVELGHPLGEVLEDEVVEVMAGPDAPLRGLIPVVRPGGLPNARDQVG